MESFRGMSMRGLVVWLAIVGTACGRLSFEPVDDASPVTDVAGRVPALPGPYFACYSLDELGTTAPDISGAGRDASCQSGTCPTSVVGRVGQALSFDGVDDRLVVPYDPGFATSQVPLSVSLWFRSSFVPPNVSLLTIANGTATLNTLEVSFATSPSRLCFGGDASAGTACITNTFSDSGWHHVAGTFTAGAVTLYVDGVQRAISGGGALVFDGHPMLIGADQVDTTTTNFFAGEIDEPCVYLRQLSDPEIVMLAGS